MNATSYGTDSTSTRENAMNHDTSGRHQVNTGHLVMGLAFAGLVAIWAVISSDLVADRDIRWLMPVPWVVAGAVGLGVAAWSSLRGKPAYDAAGVDAPASDSTEPDTREDTGGDTEPTRTIEIDEPTREDYR